MAKLQLTATERTKLAAHAKRWKKRRARLLELCDAAEKACDAARRALERAEEIATHAQADLDTAPVTPGRMHALADAVSDAGMKVRSAWLALNGSTYPRDYAARAIMAGGAGHTGGV